jgi:hypothetical protein
MAGGAQDQLFEIGIVAGGARTLDAVQLCEVELAVGATGNDPAAHVGKQLALFVSQGRSLLQDAGAPGVIDHKTALFITRLEQQLAVGRRQLALHAGLAHMGGALPWAIEQLASGEQRKQGNKYQGTGNTHL